jgi:hypothetical protein
MPKVHTLPRGVSIAPMPALRVGDVNRRLQGGLPPEPNRSASKRLSNFTGRWASDPMKRITTEYKGVRSYD